MITPIGGAALLAIIGTLLIIAWRKSQKFKAEQHEKLDDTTPADDEMVMVDIPWKKKGNVITMTQGQKYEWDQQKNDKNRRKWLNMMMKETQSKVIKPGEDFDGGNNNK